MDELHRRFLPQFVALSRTRVAAAIAAVESRERAAGASIVHEMHKIAGEAGLLGLSPLIGIARDAELKAKQLQASGGEADAELVIGALRAVDRQLDGLAAALADLRLA